MSASRPISSARSVQLLFGLAKQRFFNRWRSAYSRKTNDPKNVSVPYEERANLISEAERKRREIAGLAVPPRPVETKARPKRIGTAAKSGGLSVLAVILSAGLFFNGFNIASNILAKLANSITRANEDGFSAVSAYTLRELKNADAAYAKINAAPTASWHDAYKKTWDDHLNEVFAYEFTLEDFPESEKDERIARLWQFYRENGSSAFYTGRQAAAFMDSDQWPAPAQETVFIRGLAMLLGLFSLATVAMSLGLNNKDFGQVDWSFKWLFTLPVSARALYFAQLINAAIFNPQVWMFLVPLLIEVFISSSWSWGSLFAALAVSAYYMVLCGSLALLIEVAARKYLSLARLKSLQAFFTVFGMAFLLAYLACAFSRPVADFYAGVASALPEPILLQPFSLPAFLLSRAATTSQLEMTWGLMLVWTFLAFGSVIFCERMTREGLMRAGGPFQGARKKVVAKAGRRTWLSGVPAKEMRLLLRDHNFMVQVLVVPLIAITYYLVVNSSVLAAARGNFHHAATLAFCVGAYGLTTSAMQILNHEKATLWQLYTFPRSIISIMAEKTLVWAGFALIYASITLAIFGYFSRHLYYSAWIDCVIALYGVVLYAFIAGGIGILATNVLDTTPRGRIRADLAYLNLFLVGMYAYAIYSPSFWDKLAQLVLSTLLAYALWQKAKDRLPYLLDPEISPPPEVSLADGLIAALAFFVLQGFLTIMFFQGAVEVNGRGLTLAYGIAGLVVTILMTIALSSRKIPNLAEYLGFATKKFKSGFEAVTKSIALGLFAGAIAAAGAWIYLHVLNSVPAWRAWSEKGMDHSLLTSPDNILWMVPLLVIAAPLCEEFIFRGLVFRGLRRSLHPALAVIISAALFALVHPPVSVIPVFGLGIATALVFEKTRFLLAPVVTHAMYNACVIVLNHS